MAISWSFDRAFERSTDSRKKAMTAATTDDVGPMTVAVDAPVEAEIARPAERGSKRLAWMIGVTIALFVLFMTMILLSLSGKPADEAFVEAADDLMTQTQRLAKAMPGALRGDADAMTQLRDSRDRLAAGVEALDKGGIIDNIGVRAAQGAERTALAPLAKDWADVRSGVDAVLDNAKMVTAVGAVRRKLVDASPAFTDGTDAFATRMAAGAAPRDAVAAAQLQMLAQRIARRAADLPGGADTGAVAVARRRHLSRYDRRPRRRRTRRRPARPRRRAAEDRRPVPVRPEGRRRRAAEGRRRSARAPTRR